ncbi:MAG: alpha/beta hydrolase [Pseudomonadota bacterium]
MIWFDPATADTSTPAAAPVRFVSGVMGDRTEWRWLSHHVRPAFRSVALVRAAKMFASRQATHVVAHRTAASVMLELAATQPWRFRSLTLIDADMAPALPEFTDTALFQAGREARRTARVFAMEGDAWNAMRTMVDFWYGEGRWAQTSFGLQTRLALRAGRLISTYADQETHELSPVDLAGVVCPTLLITGEEAPVEALAVHGTLTDALPFAQPMFVSGAGVSSHLTDPHIVHPAIREFLVRAEAGWQGAATELRQAA